MPICKICNEEEANQTGAHVFPAWMIASAFDGKGRNRDYEIIFSINDVYTDLPYFGRSVKPDSIKENIGRELSDAETTSQSTQLIVDNIWCRKCERKLKVTEDYFLDKIDKQLNDFSDSKDYAIDISVNTFIIRLFMYSLIYRASIVNDLGFSLSEKVNRKLQGFLNKYLKEDLKSTIDFLDSNDDKDELRNFPIRCLKTEPEKRPSKPVYINPTSQRPYFLIVNNYIIQFYTKESHLRSTQLPFFGITNILSRNKCIVNYKESTFKVGILDLKEWSNVMNKFNNFISDLRVKRLVLVYNGLVKKKTGKSPSRMQEFKFLNLLANNNEKLGMKYTLKKITEAMNKSLHT